jgi:dTDP-glucose pyrophosphorylase
MSIPMLRVAVVAAAGRGTRMGEIAGAKPKHLIPVNGQPFLFYLLDRLQSAGIEEIVLIGGHQFPAMEEFVAMHGPKFNITLVDQFQRLGEERYGTALAIEAAKPEVGEREFLAVYGDNLFTVRDLQKVINAPANGSYIATLQHPNPERYGVVLSDVDGTVTKIVEKPKDPVGNQINAGLYRFTPQIFSVLPTQPSPRGEYELTDAVQTLAEAGQMKAISLDDYWQDFGRPEDIEVASGLLTDGYNSDIKVI